MVAVLIATLIAGIGLWLYLRSTNATTSSGGSGPSDSEIAATTPDGGTYKTAEGATYQKIGGVSFLTDPSPAMKAAAAAGATSYDLNDPASAQRRLDALNAAQYRENQTPEQLAANQAHLAQDLASQQLETQTIMDVSAQRQAAVSAAAAGAAAAAASAVANGQVASMPTPSMAIARRGIGHFGGVAAPIIDIAPGTSKSTAAYVTAVANAGPPPGTVAPAGMYWNYTTQSFQPAM
jgi:hypothetical protein